ncbi:BrnT family toxin [Amaricoccus sp. W119]|uniref:BrnT family toxin n=1 Tax=Amaricoccus sp. W119 TaxID=3391833 RepID=UPI0039A499B9
MTELRFTWDEAKNRGNWQKHGLDFEEAVRVFADPLHLSWQDRIEDGEMRWQTIGMVGGTTLLLVAHTVREDDENGRPVEVVRVISARAATRRERRRYEDGD